VARAAGPGSSTTRLLGLICAVLWLAGGAHAGDDAAAKAAELKQLQTRISSLQAKLLANQSQKTRTERQIEDVEQGINATGRSLHKTQQAQVRLVRQLESLTRQRQATSDGMRGQAAALAREARAAYAMGRQQQVKLLLNQEKPSTVGRALIYFSYFSRLRQTKIEAMRATLKQLDDLQAQIQEKTRSLASLEDEQQQRSAQLASQRRQRQQVLAGLTQQLSAQGGELKRLQRNEQALQALVRSLQEVLSDIPVDTSRQKPFKALKGLLHWPAQGRLAKSFGSRRGSSGLLWQGVFIKAPEGGQVHAVSQGRVAFADWLRGFGLLLIIDHGDGYMSLYGQNQALYKEVGEWVDSGEVIATLGASGGQTDSGLYFEIRHNGHPVNPLRWCSGKPEAVSG